MKFSTKIKKRQKKVIYFPFTNICIPERKNGSRKENWIKVRLKSSRFGQHILKLHDRLLVESSGSKGL